MVWSTNNMHFIHRLGWLLFSIMAVATLIGDASCKRAGPPRLVAVKAAAMLDVEAGRLIRDVLIVIEGDRIRQVAPAANAKIPSGAQVLDLSRATVLPGLIDAHVHLAWRARPGPFTGDGGEAAEKTLRAGFTTVRNPGSTGKADIALRDAINEGRVLGPRILAAGPALGIAGGVCDQVFAGEGVATGDANAKAKTREILAAGADIIKLCAGGGVIPSVRDLQVAEYSEAEIRAIVEEAHKAARPTLRARRPSFAPFVQGWIRSSMAVCSMNRHRN